MFLFGPVLFVGFAFETLCHKVGFLVSFACCLFGDCFWSCFCSCFCLVLFFLWFLVWDSLPWNWVSWFLFLAGCLGVVFGRVFAHVFVWSYSFWGFWFETFCHEIGSLGFFGFGGFYWCFCRCFALGGIWIGAEPKLLSFFNGWLVKVTLFPATPPPLPTPRTQLSISHRSQICTFLHFFALFSRFSFFHFFHVCVTFLHFVALLCHLFAPFGSLWHFCVSCFALVCHCRVAHFGTFVHFCVTSLHFCVTNVIFEMSGFIWFWLPWCTFFYCSVTVCLASKVHK